MGNIMLSLGDDYEKLLRKIAQERYEGKKGSLSTVVENALDKLKSENELVKKRLQERLRKGIDFEYKMYQKRSEIYD